MSDGPIAKIYNTFWKDATHDLAELHPLVLRTRQHLPVGPLRAAPRRLEYERSSKTTTHLRKEVVSMTNYLWRVRVAEYPVGSVEPVYRPGEGDPVQWVPVPGWAPPGWQPDADYVKQFGMSEFVWPSTQKIYRSYSGVKKRAKLLESFGATVAIERSIIRWLEVELVRYGEVVSPHELDMEEWLVLDEPRSLAHDCGNREVLEELGTLTPYAGDLKRWCKLPVRLVRSDSDVWAEVGPYTRHFSAAVGFNPQDEGVLLA